MQASRALNGKKEYNGVLTRSHPSQYLSSRNSRLYLTHTQRCRSWRYGRHWSSRCLSRHARVRRSCGTNLVVHEQIDSAPNGFLHTGPASDSTALNLRIALVYNDMAGLEKALYDVSTPSSSLYGQHWSKAEVEFRGAPRRPQHNVSIFEPNFGSKTETLRGL
ncbi:hypothetical protein JB92DRAFT_2972837 [Gautieria morchelliformis]|nr:hypothetical protein JB92DRAFT_2972837 [Gautieria morchelliformis]